MDECARCGAEASSQICWWCRAHLCGGCWDAEGHCGHVEADAANLATGEAQTWDERQKVIARALAAKRVV